MSRSRAEKIARRVGWAGAAVVAALAPKCVGCLAAYIGLGAVFGVTGAGAEICGANAAVPLAAFAWLGAMVGIGAWFTYRRWQRKHTPVSEPGCCRAR